MMKSVTILGSTGSIGQSTVKIIEAHRDKYDVRILTAYSNYTLLAQQALSLQPQKVVIGKEEFFAPLKDLLKDTDIKVLVGRESLLEAAGEEVDWTMAAIVGMAGLEPLLCAIKRGGQIAIANKEPLVAAGELVLAEAAKGGAVLLPVDSEHNAIFQVLDQQNRQAVSRIVLTASGGPFLHTPLEEMQKASPQQALKHPNWDMGAKVSVDSATLMNKGLEVIEAHILFGLPPEKIEVLIHPQSVIHSMVEYVDGSILAQMGAADMCTPIAHTLAYPARISTPGETLDLQALSQLDFRGVDAERFPALGLAYRAIEGGQHARIALNAANEIAVAAFLENFISFSHIVEVVNKAMEKSAPLSLNGLDAILAYDKKMRETAHNAIVEMNKQHRAA